MGGDDDDGGYGGGVSPELTSPAEAEAAAQPLSPSCGLVSGAKLRDAPILLFVFFHKALSAELTELRRVAAAESGRHGGSGNGNLIIEIRRRFEFLKILYKYHCAAEDEVIFLALDAHIKNVACTYSLEHKSIDDLFRSIFHCLDVLIKSDGNTAKSFKELVLLISTIQTTICHHMLKEEEQVFPLLMKQFSRQEQAALVWQFICSVPVLLLEDFLPWMTSFLSSEEKAHVENCLKEIVPEEKLLKEVVISWLGNKNQPFGSPSRIGGAQSVGPANLKDALKVYSFKSFSIEIQQWKEVFGLKTNVEQNPVDGLHLWHVAIGKELKGILEELYQIRSSDSFSTLASVIVQLKFLADILFFYSNALDKIFYPLLDLLSNGCLSPSNKRFPDESQIEDLQRLLHYDAKNGTSLSKFVEKLCWELESFVIGIDDHMVFQEMEVLPLITAKCSHEMQKWLLYMSLLMMPLGLLKCAITWFLAHLSEEESKSILKSIKREDSLVNTSLASLLHEWVRIGYSGKTSVEKFRKDLQEIFKSRSCFHSDQIEEDGGSFFSPLDAKPCKKSNSGLMKPIASKKATHSVNDSSSSGSHTSEKHGTSYSSGINLHIFFPGTLELFHPIPNFPDEMGDASSIFNLEPRPVDLIFFFHKALKKDLDFLVIGSAKLSENIGCLADFHQRFHLIRFLYQIHSDAEDEIAFPALEAKGKGKNISHSYTIDHKLGIEHFNKLSFVLDEMSKLHISVSSVHLDKMDQRMLKYQQQCMKLHDMCKSLQKILCDHVNHEEIELWPLFRECFSDEEQEKIIGSILGRLRAEILQEMLPWLMASLTPEEQHALMSIWRKATKKTMFEEWLEEWWDGMNQYAIAKVVEESKMPQPWLADPLEVVSRYLSKKDTSEEVSEKSDEFLQEDSVSANILLCENHAVDDKKKLLDGDHDDYQFSECMKPYSENEKRSNKLADVTNQGNKPSQLLQDNQQFSHQEHLLSMSQDDLEAAIRRVSRDSSLDPQNKSHIIQNLLMSRWIVRQQKSHSEAAVLGSGKETPGQCPSYRDPLKLIYGCKHYKRNCKLVSACCNQLYACRLCHDDVADHSMDRKKTTKMMCMRCLVIQPVGPTCSTASCNNLTMAKYYCRICKFFDDEREIYHCPFCNLCRVGKGLGIDYFHCMNCNACMSRSLSEHICREKCLEDNCPICHEFIFTSSSPVKSLPCGHLMHSACFQDYTCTHYTCPICSKTLGDMQVYFGMLDALLAEEKIPDEYSTQTQIILCNDCEKRGTAAFHWLYHKCPYCSSYNTRVI